MKKVYLFLTLALMAGITNVNAQIYLNSFTGASACPTNGNTPTMALNSTGTPVSRNIITCTATANVFNSSTLNNTASVVNTSYIEFSATAAATYQLNLTSVSFLRQGSATAPNQIEVRYSTDGFVTSTSWGAAPLTPTAGSVITWDFADFSTPVAGTVTFRIYPYGTQRCDLGATAAASTGTFRLDDVTINGTVAIGGPLGANINVTPSSLSGFTALASTYSAEQTYIVDGIGLTTDLVITPPVGFEISTATGAESSAPITITPTLGVIVAQTIYVKMNSATLGINSGNITNISAGSNNPTVSLTGHVITTEPAIQSSITIPAPSITTTTMVVNFSGGDGAKRILVARAGSAVNSDPVDGTTYAASAVFGSGTQIGTGNYAVYVGAGNTVTVTNLSPDVTYYFAVYEFNDAGIPGAENYLTVAPGTGNATTLSTDGDFRSVATGNWSDAAIWQVRSGSVWAAAVAAPTSTARVYIQTGHTVTVDVATASCSDLNLNTAGILAMGANTIEVSGKLRAYTAATAVVAIGADGTFYTSQANTTAVGNSLTSSAGIGKLKFIGSTRVIAFTGEWGNNPAGWDVEFAPTPGETFTIQTGFKAGNITVSSGTVVSTNTDMRPDGGGGAGTGTLTVKNGSTLKFSNNSITIQRVGTASATAHFASLTVEAGATLEFSGTSSPVIAAGAVTFSGAVIYSGAGNQNFAIKGAANTAAVDPNVYTDVTVAGGGNKTLPLAITANGVLTLTSGYVISTATNLLTLGNASSVSGASNTSYVSGPVKKIGNSLFTFPVGKTGTGYVPIGVSNFAGTLDPVNDAFTAEYIRANASALGTITDPNVVRVSGCDYWTLINTTGTATVDVTAFWSANNVCNGSYIDDILKVELAHFNGVNWNSSSWGFSSRNGTAATGDITWAGVNTFSPFAIGSTDLANNLLPISISYFNGTKQNSSHLLNWKVNCNSTPSATLILERSTDGRNYSEVYTINATALRCQQPFNYTDAAPAKGVNFYRLKMIDATGKISYSSIVSLLNASAGFDILNIAPNPIVGGNFKLNISAAKAMPMDVVITDMQGRVMQKQTVNMIAGFNTIPMNVTNLSAGNYQIYGITAEGRSSVLRFVIQ